MKYLTPLLLLLVAAAPTTQPADRFESYTERLGGTAVKFDMVLISAGKIRFSIDNKSPSYEVNIKRFWIAKTECTWDELDVFSWRLDVPKDKRPPYDARTFPSEPLYDRFGTGHSGYPAYCIKLKIAKRYCEWLSQKTGRKYRLPTPAEWEYACRAGDEVAKAANETAWTEENSDNEVHTVGTKKPNAFGIYDMLGNVGEWTLTADGKTALVCGGFFRVPANKITSNTRERVNEELAPPSNWWLTDPPYPGLRVVREE
jgi:formylglycine-generating enzyme required for sulfatase activity